MPAPHIRPLRKEDAASFKALQIEGSKNMPSAFDEYPDEIAAESLRIYEGRLADHGAGDFVMGAFNGPTLVGTVGFYRSAYRKMLHKGTIWGMYVTPSERRKKVGQSLMLAAIEKARATPGVIHLCLCVNVTNLGAQALYKSVGFEVYGQEPAIIKVDDVYLDEVLMQLKLK